MVSVGFSISTREQRQEELEGRCCQWRHIGGSSAGPGSGNFQIEHSSQSPVQETRSYMNAAFRIQLHLIRVHHAQVAEVGQDGHKGLSLSEQKAWGAGQGDISDIMIRGVVFNWDPPISVPKRKPRISQSQLLFQ